MAKPTSATGGVVHSRERGAATCGKDDPAARLGSADGNGEYGQRGAVPAMGGYHDSLAGSFQDHQQRPRSRPRKPASWRETSQKTQAAKIARSRIITARDAARVMPKTRKRQRLQPECARPHDDEEIAVRDLPGQDPARAVDENAFVECEREPAFRTSNIATGRRGQTRPSRL